MYTDRYTHTLTYKYMRKPGDLLCNVRYSPSSHTRVRRTYGRYMRNGEQSKVTETEMEMEMEMETEMEMEVFNVIHSDTDCAGRAYGRYMHMQKGSKKVAETETETEMEMEMEMERLNYVHIRTWIGRLCLTATVLCVQMGRGWV